MTTTRRRFFPKQCPERLSPVVSDAIHLLIDVSERRLRQSSMSTACGGSSAGAASVKAMLGDIARLMAERMAYRDPIRIAQLKLAGLDEAWREGRITPR